MRTSFGSIAVNLDKKTARRWNLERIGIGSGTNSLDALGWHSISSSSRLLSAECERLFSAAGLLLSPLRSQLDVQMLSVILALRSWYQSGLIKEIDRVLLSLSEEVEQRD
jgi:hypothetical protein